MGAEKKSPTAMTKQELIDELGWEDYPNTPLQELRDSVRHRRKCEAEIAAREEEHQQKQREHAAYIEKETRAADSTAWKIIDFLFDTTCRCPCHREDGGRCPAGGNCCP